MPIEKLNLKKISTLSTYKDWMAKSIHDLKLYEQSSSVYDMANCFLSLNALPEWIANSDDAPDALREVAQRKLLIMQEHKSVKDEFVFDENKLDQIDQQLRLVRIFCNHSKHGRRKEILPRISKFSIFPCTFPIRFENMAVGNTHVVAVDLLKDVVSFWESEISSFE